MISLEVTTFIFNIAIGFIIYRGLSKKIEDLECNVKALEEILKNYNLQ